MSEARAGTDAALDRCVDLLLSHPDIDYVLLEVAAPLGGPGGLAIERGPAGAPFEEAPAETPGGLAAALKERSLTSAARLPVGDDGSGSLTLGSRRASALAEPTLGWCEAAANIFESMLTERRLEAELLLAQRAQLTAALASAIVHDVNNVLTGIVGFASILASELPADHPALRHVQMIDSLSTTGHDLTRQLLDFARAAGGAAELLDLNEVVREVRALTASVMLEGIALSLDPERSLPLVRAERALLHQALTNLVLNALDAMPDGGKIVLRTRVTAGTQGKRRVAIDVIDEGTDIGADVLPHVFKPFFTTKEAGSGTGLGLTSVQRIAQRHGGSVEVKSTPGSGSTFTLRLPEASNRNS